MPDMPTHSSDSDSRFPISAGKLSMLLDPKSLFESSKGRVTSAILPSVATDSTVKGQVTNKYSKRVSCPIFGGTVVSSFEAKLLRQAFVSIHPKAESDRCARTSIKRYKTGRTEK